MTAAAAAVEEEELVTDIKLSTVVPASVTGENKSHHLTNLDLALKLHYVTTVHFFGGDAAAGLTILDFKKAMFRWLQLYYTICGRVRRGEGDGDGGRPYVKCNDSGVRVVEATCGKTVEEWLAVVDGGDHHRLLVYDQPILARDFGFTPLVFLQLTKFKCGGLCVGMRWAHMIGDAFSAVDCINMWGKIMADQAAPLQFLAAPTSITHSRPNSPPSSSAAKLLEPVGDNWIIPNKSKMQTHTFHIPEENLRKLQSRERNATPFQIISAVVWKSMAELTGNRIITVIENTKPNRENHEHESPSNSRQMIGVVEAETAGQIADGDPIVIAELISEKFIDQTGAIEEQMEEGDGMLDLVVYGANLTFVNLEGVDLYGLQMKDRRPIFANVSIGGVGDGGAVVAAMDESGGGRVVNVILPEDQLHHLKNKLSMGLF